MMVVQTKLHPNRKWVLVYILWLYYAIVFDRALALYGKRN